MSQPPDDFDPNEEDNQNMDQNQGSQHGTKPLNPLFLQGRGSTEDGAPPATVLKDTSAETGDRRGRLMPPDLIETGRVRLVPRVPDPPPWRIILQVEGPGQTTIGLDVRQALVLGRLDPDGEQNPDLDLTPYMAQEHGVSRRHAILIPEPEALYLADLQSSNGTWANSSYLEPGQRHPLSTGDQIELGLLRLRVRSISLVRR